jgi:hypothetical protein
VETGVPSLPEHTAFVDTTPLAGTVVSLVIGYAFVPRSVVLEGSMDAEGGFIGSEGPASALPLDRMAASLV